MHHHVLYFHAKNSITNGSVGLQSSRLIFFSQQDLRKSEGNKAAALEVNSYVQMTSVFFIYTIAWRVFIFRRFEVCEVILAKIRARFKMFWAPFTLEITHKTSPHLGGLPHTERLHTKLHTKLSINRLCSTTFEQLLAFWATFCSASNLEQLLPSLATFEQQIGIKLIQTIKKVFI